MRPLFRDSVFSVSGTVWWGEAADEPARADARPTKKCKLYHYCIFALHLSAVFLSSKLELLTLWERGPAFGCSERASPSAS